MTSQINEEFPKIYKKGWGYEKWIVNDSLYCGKILFFEKNKKCSWHYHKMKTETFYLLKGELVVYFSENDNLDLAQTAILKPGDVFHVPIQLRHQMYALQESELLEISTQHFEEDSYRLVKGD